MISDFERNFSDFRQKNLQHGCQSCNLRDQWNILREFFIDDIAHIDSFGILAEKNSTSLSKQDSACPEEHFEEKYFSE